MTDDINKNNEENKEAAQNNAENKESNTDANKKQQEQEQDEETKRFIRPAPATSLSITKAGKSTTTISGPTANNMQKKFAVPVRPDNAVKPEQKTGQKTENPATAQDKNPAQPAAPKPDSARQEQKTDAPRPKQETDRQAAQKPDTARQPAPPKPVAKPDTARQVQLKDTSRQGPNSRPSTTTRITVPAAPDLPKRPAPAAQLNAQKEEQPQGGIKKIIIVCIEVLVVLGILGALGFYYSETLLDALVHTRKITSVPDIKERSVLVALDTLAENNLALKKAGAEFDPSIPAGMIIRQLPSPGTVVREGKIVRVWLSQGGEAVFAPKLIGLPLRNAELIIRQNQLLLGEISERYSLVYAKGLIMEQDPPSDAALEKNALINVVVSSGEPPESIILMPNFVNKKRSVADDWAEKHGIEIDYKEDTESSFANDTIIAQEMTPDTVLQTGAKLQITISYKNEDGTNAKLHNIYYEVPKGTGAKKVRIMLTDSNGEREIFSGEREPGDIVRLSVPHAGRARLRYFVDEVLVGEGEIQ